MQCCTFPRCSQVCARLLAAVGAADPRVGGTQLPPTPPPKQLTPLKLNQCQVVNPITACQIRKADFTVSSVTVLATVFRL